MKKDKQAYAELVKKLSPQKRYGKSRLARSCRGRSDLRHRAGHQRRFFIWIKMGDAERGNSNEHLSGVSIRPADRLGRL
ncbi:MAG: hypothetical protein V8Q79_11295 [Christensenellales bacterium]